MDAPNKIYIDGFSCFAIEPREVDSIVAGEEVCYIRKEALLEWAKEKYEQSLTFVSGNPEADHYVQITALSLVKKIESL